MKKDFIVIITVLCISVLVILINKNIGDNKDYQNNEIILNTNGGVPYTWEYKIENPNIVRLKDKFSDVKNPEVSGGPVELHYIFKGLKKGETIITFEYKNFTNNIIDETKKYKVFVDKNLKLTIKILN